MSPGRVSVVLPVRNRPATLVEAVESVRRQTYSDWELWIVDDGSTDATPEVAQALAKEDPRIQLLRQPHGGPGLARETGRQAAHGEFLQYLDSDDLLLPRKLELQVRALRASPDAGIAYCRCRETDEEGRALAKPLRPSDRSIETVFPTFLLCRWWNTLTPLYRAELCARAGPWLPLLQEEDWELDARIGSLGPKLVFVDEELAEVRRHVPDRLSATGLAERAKLRDRARAHCEILGHARRAGVSRDAPEMGRFARELFLLSRQCGAADLPADSRELLRLARGAAAAGLSRWFVLVAYGAGARLLGWRRAALLASALDGVRRTHDG